MNAERAHLLDFIKDHLRRVWSHPNQREREDLMMETNDKLAKGVEMLLERTEADEAKMASLQAANDQQGQEIAALKAAAADAGDATAWDAKAKGLLDKIEALVGPIDDDTSGAGSAPVVGATSTTVQGTDGSTTTLDHATSTATTTDASGATVATDTAAADAAKAAATQAGAIPNA